jgi:uncharacterized protein
MNEGMRVVVCYRLQRARESLEEARLLGDSGHSNACMNRLYYACFYAASALLYANNLSSSKHSGVRALFGRHFVKEGIVPTCMGEIYNDLYEYRQESDYKDFFQAEASSIQTWSTQAKQFVDAN